MDYPPSMRQHLNLLLAHLRFKQAQQKMCHSPKFDEGVDIFFKLLEHLFLDHFFKELLTDLIPKPLELFN